MFCQPAKKSSKANGIIASKYCSVNTATPAMTIKTPAKKPKAVCDLLTKRVTALNLFLIFPIEGPREMKTAN